MVHGENLDLWNAAPSGSYISLPDRSTEESITKWRRKILGQHR